MIARVLPWPNVCFVFLMIVLTFPGCGRGISQFVTKPVQGSQNLSIDEITQMAGQSLQMMEAMGFRSKTSLPVTSMGESGWSKTFMAGALK